ncbi:hypothetical protein L1987_15019 [Smallanthus sonchifolius]|uniref:Uncharacterized protein n=1 Tax=Smallanthus sonchifolius TaxID=185202 RepID=A0ACB9J4Y5_9ASTR|nr:hypothetical protein L1987_15019 [Smallanthus sonchifolius]
MGGISSSWGEEIETSDVFILSDLDGLDGSFLLIGLGESPDPNDTSLFDGASADPMLGGGNLTLPNLLVGYTSTCYGDLCSKTGLMVRAYGIGHLCRKSMIDAILGSQHVSPRMGEQCGDVCTQDPWRTKRL